MKLSKMIKRATACFLCIAMGMCVLTGCGKTVDDGDASDAVSSTDAASSVAGATMFDATKTEADYETCLDDTCGYTDMMNYTLPENGEEIIVMTIKDKGTVKIQLFPELLPKACANFVGLVSQGYYDGLTFHRVIADFMIQGGDPLGSGMGGSAVWGEKFDGGVTKYLSHVKGALAYANSGSTSTDGSQFYIVVGSQYPAEVVDQYSSVELTDKVREAYATDGGTPWLDGSYTVFGQVFEGMDIITDICNNTSVGANDKPLEDVIIEKVEIAKYE